MQQASSKAVVAAMLMVLSGQAWADAPPMTWDQAEHESCASYREAMGTEAFGPMSDALSEHFMNTEGGENFGSSCNISDYVEAVCKEHPRFTVGEATDYLFSRHARRLPLPRIKQCGA